MGLRDNRNSARGALTEALGSMRYVFFSLLLMAITPALASQCLTYNAEVTLRGVLSKETFPEQPGYENIANGDRAATYFFISPAQAICVAAGNTKDNEPAESQIGKVQLVFAPDALGYDWLRPFLGKQVECRGSFFHAISGHHHSSVLLGSAKCHAA